MLAAELRLVVRPQQRHRTQREALEKAKTELAAERKQVRSRASRPLSMPDGRARSSCAPWSKRTP
jgi:hypothetical protein